MGSSQTYVALYLKVLHCREAHEAAPWRYTLLLRPGHAAMQRSAPADAGILLAAEERLAAGCRNVSCDEPHNSAFYGPSRPVRKTAAMHVLPTGRPDLNGKLVGVEGDRLHDNVLERAGLERRAADEETVNVRLRAQVGAVVGAHRASVLDARVCGHIGRHRYRQEATDAGVHGLRVLLGRALPCADRPHGLVRDHNLAPLLHGQHVGDRLELRLAHVECGPGLPLLQRLADARHHVEALRDSILDLLGDQLVGLIAHQTITRLWRGTALAVAQDDPLDAQVNQLVRCHLAGERACATKVAVLRRDLDLGVEAGLDSRQVKERRRNDDLDLVKELWAVLDRLVQPSHQLGH
mmetsp:Transcript_24892/g.73599  ORF Transcript_24892/g.73599 Transcript_24892/m.73599 type:complete len:351 (+) Transcript_24892:107-1159(+)